MLDDILQRYGRPIDGARIAIVVAHPDDEAVAFVSVLRRYPDALLVHVTDGSPTDASQWKGMVCREAYAALREREKAAALEAVGHSGPRLMLGITDSKAVWYIRTMVARLTDILKKNQTEIVLTHAFEGGHPDHDAIAYAVYLAAARSTRIIEAPFYRMGDEGSIWQSFVPARGISEHVVHLDAATRRIKETMLAAYRSQSEACANVSLESERFRLARPYDWAMLPPRLSRNYMRAGIDQVLWSSLVEAAR